MPLLLQTTPLQFTLRGFLSADIFPESVRLLCRGNDGNVADQSQRESPPPGTVGKEVSQVFPQGHFVSVPGVPPRSSTLQVPATNTR